MVGGTTRASLEDPMEALTLAPSRSAVRVRGLRKSYGDVVALQDLDIDIASGSVVGLIGPNGAGKTTAALCIAGLLKPDAGEVSFARPLKPGRSPLAIATQEIALYPGLSAATNLSYFGRLSGVTNVAQMLAEVAAELDLEPLLDKLPKDLSIGQQRAVHVAAALMATPNLLLLDEPTAGLDVVARAAVLAAVTRRRSAGIAVLLSSHQMLDIEAVCDEVVMVNEGRVIAAGRVDDLVARHGGARIEVTVDGKVRVVDGEDVPAAITQVTAHGGRVESVEVIKPSLEAVFLSLTGIRGRSGERA
jgi:ABC-2 type transport system ATP-binding protein